MMDSTIQKMGMVKQFKEEAKEPIGDVWAEARAWMKSKFTDDTYKEFYIQRGTNRSRHIPAVAIFVPIICVDAPLYSVDIDENGDIDSIESRAFLLSAARVPRWPSIFHNYLARSTPEALITIVTVDYLEEFLERLAQWFSDIGDYLRTIDETVVRQALVQEAFLQSLMSVMGQPHQFDGLWRV